VASALFQWQAALGYFVGDEDRYGPDHDPNIQPDISVTDVSDLYSTRFFNQVDGWRAFNVGPAHCEGPTFGRCFNLF
jgi:hypothetical protein